MVSANRRQLAGLRVGRDAAVVDPELTDLVERWMEETISDIEDGLARAGRLEPHERHFRGVLAVAQPDYVAQNWDRAGWKLSVTRCSMSSAPVGYGY